MHIAWMRLIESYIVISLHQLDSSLVYENVSDLQVVAAAQTEDTEEQEDVE